MIIAHSWVYLESVSSASTRGNNKVSGDGKTENNVVIVEEEATIAIGNTKAAQRLLPCWGFTNYVAMLGFHKLCCHVFIDFDKLLKRYVL